MFGIELYILIHTYLSSKLEVDGNSKRIVLVALILLVFIAHYWLKAHTG